MLAHLKRILQLSYKRCIIAVFCTLKDALVSRMANRTFGTLSGDHHLSCWLCRSQNITYIDTQSVLNIQYPWTPKTLSILKLCVNSMSNQFICDSDTMDPSFEEIAQEPQLTPNQNLLDVSRSLTVTVLSICQWISLSYLILLPWRNYNIIPLDSSLDDRILFIFRKDIFWILISLYTY